MVGGTYGGSGGGGSLTCASASATAVSASNGRRPASISYATTPRAYTSDRPVAGRPTAASGARYWAVPMTSPVLVIATASAARAMPKSVSFAVPSGSMRMLAGLTSRWIRPFLCAACSALAACATISTVSIGDMGARSSMSFESGRPGTYSMTR